MKTVALLLLSLLPASVSGDAPVVRAVPYAPVVRAAPSVSVMERIPQSYLVFGYGTDRQGKGPYLDIHGNALPMNHFPQAINIQGLKGVTLAGLTPKPLVPVARPTSR